MEITRNFQGPNQGQPNGYVPNTLVQSVPVNDDLNKILQDIINIITELDTKLVATHADQTSAHGVVGNVVGTSDTQTLTNKTIDATSNTVTNLTANNLQTGYNIPWERIVHTAKIKNEDLYENIALNNVSIPDGGIAYAKLDLANKIISTDIVNSSIITTKIADSNVTTAKIADSNVTTAKIADSNVTTVKIADGAITTAKLAPGCVTTTKIVNGAITTDKYANTSITAAKIADGAVTTAKIADNAITADKIDTSIVQRIYFGTSEPPTDSTYRNGDVYIRYT